MFEPTFQFASFTFPKYTTLVAIALLISGGFTLYRTPSDQRLLVLDVLIGGLIGGIILARIEHVLLNWNYFAYNTYEITQIHQGGLDWHGAVVGAGIGIMVVSRWRKVAIRPMLDTLCLLIPLLSLAVWWGCWASSCRYGLEVATLADYPSWLVWEGRDIYGIYAPRFHTQQLGMMLSLILLMVTLVLIWRNWAIGWRFWLLLSLAACIIFFISFLQDDYSVAIRGIRVTQYLDAIVILYAIYISWRVAYLT